MCDETRTCVHSPEFSAAAFLAHVLDTDTRGSVPGRAAGCSSFSSVRFWKTQRSFTQSNYSNRFESSLRNILNLQRNIAKRLEQESTGSGGETAAVDRPVFSLHEPRTADAAVMTPVHFETVQRDTSYHWNEWELRRRALEIADILNRTTRSSQTTLSHCRMEQETQVYLLKDKEQNTMKCKGTSAIRKKKYIVGLRGKADIAAKTVKIELDL
ncbi:UPF0704 protein C6orf165 homolog, related [Neospora caninum Liverpool]|uniref:Cilia- and flagella-associated protein 206 n=1 Tax=Neospora caninum (strain Liverpool) TaxID=572307 RepID=F0VHT7_NEOCL|nr:UPF0704 protein C6orf165 homolog, related [Neospora caninum Liverpool]CBZ53298.1 UPF0704 protein C6orf165 homolog, related [Neospora caninum Liverpool]CEL67284.1 TPA: UPF0704 protein C6orf165 homolog, related [Neospora caninum Liverpool]|eukprot:XP_003883330.1 UPF0704 protein C6orf165 homolog, related [Neospora caninum Liverpool]